MIGLTCRVGRAVFGTIRIIEDLVKSGQSTLLLGRPGVGKTTMLREVARFLADDMNKRVVVVDTSNEIAGDGDIPHPGIGSARRMQVPTPTLQHAVMIEAVENHMPEVIVIDEIGTDLEAAAARTIAERGVQLVGTAHGNTLENLIMNPTLSDLIGGIQSVTLGDDEARRRGTQKSILDFWGQLTGAFFVVMVAISSIGLMVGGIGVMNIMLVSVVERTREIGIRKALGARERDIWGQFLIEAAFLTFTGGIIGVIVGWVVSYLVSATEIMTTVVTADIVILAVSVSVGIGLFFGFYPAWNASRLNPIEALRHE